MGTLDAVIARLVDELGSSAVVDAPLGALTTYRVGGQASILVTAESPDDLRRVGSAMAAVGSPDIELLVLGRGSNLLIADAGFGGVAVQLGESFASVAVEGSVLQAGGAALLPVAARRSVAAGLAGFEWAVGVPGTVGGAVRMNAGGHGSDMAASVLGVRVVDLRSGEDSEMDPTQLAFGYRRSALRAEQVVVECRIGLASGPVDTGDAQLAEIVRWRRENQPGGANAGSVFTNPAGDSAGSLIDRAGLKGFRIGTAEVSLKHANFIQADPAGSADDVAALMAEIRSRVLETFGVDLHAETHLIGFAPEVASAAGATV